MNKSFTLIEILVVIVVIGIISSFIIIGLSSVSDKANIAKGQAFINSLDNSMLLARTSSWKLDEGVGTSISDSWGPNNGTLVNFNFDSTDGWRSSNNCISNNCLEFDGGNDFINLGTAFGNLGLNNFTISLWFIAQRDGAYRAFLSKGLVGANDFLLYKPDSNAIRFYCDAGILDLSTNLWNGNKWNNVTATRNGTLVKMYIDGKYVNQDNTATANITNSHNWNIGASEDGTQRFLDGFIDDVKVYNDAIPTSQIQQNYYSGINKLYRNKGIVLNEFNQRLTELKSNLTINE